MILFVDVVYTAIYTLFRGQNMQSAKLFINGRSQAVRLPKEYQFTGTEVLIQKVGDAVILLPHEKSWEIFLHGLNSFSDDFFEEGRDQGENQNRESF
jgi:antitoxin VapB